MENPMRAENIKGETGARIGIMIKSDTSFPKKPVVLFIINITSWAKCSDDDDMYTSI